jgi:hypothetical protein
MNCEKPEPRLARLYELLPAIYRIRDVEQGEPLKGLLSVIAEQVNVVEDDIARLYDNWFIETAQDWVVPYLGDLIGYTPVSEAGDPAVRSPALDRILVPRRDVAHTIRARRRKGTLALLEELARDTAGYPARAVEFFRLLAYCQNLNHLRPARGRSVDVRKVDVLDRLDGPFDELAHTVDVRRIQEERSAGGRYNIPDVGVFVWRLRPYSVTEAPAACIEEVGPGSYTFSVLGNDTPLFTRPRAETDPTSIAGESNLPVPIRRHALEENLAAYYGEGRSFQVWRGAKKRNKVSREPLDPKKLVVADLSDWTYQARKGTVVLDPALGRLGFPPGELPAGVWVSYHYGFSADIGGGEYDRPLRPADPGGLPDVFYSRISHRGDVTSVEDALEAWKAVRGEKPQAVLEIADSDVYAEQLNIVLHKGESLQIRAANRTRPLIYLLDRERNLPDSLTVTTEAGDGKEEGGCFTLDGVLIAGRPVHVEGHLQRVTILNSTLVPGWDLDVHCEPKHPTEPSLELYRTNAQVRIGRSILGSIQVYQDEVTSDPTPLSIEDSVIDATAFDREAVGAPNWPLAHARVVLRDSTVLGEVQTHAIELAENSIFMGTVRVARRQTGCMRFCYVPPGSRTPRRHRCQPDLVEAPIRSRPGWRALTPGEKEKALSGERLRVRPQFDSTRYGQATYARLARACALEIRAGADDESEMGAFHDLFEPRRLANLRARLEEYTPARADAGIILAD